MTTRTLLVAALLLSPAALLLAPPASAQQPYDDAVTSWDGHKVPITVYPAKTGQPAPTLLWGHGWAGSRADAVDTGALYSNNGYNVVAMDFRGFGAARSTSTARVHDVNLEIRDVIAVIDHVAKQPWAQLDAPGDPRLGALGGSYGGGYQLLAAGLDPRLDAIAPEITWNDLPRSLAPNGGLKSAWLDLLYWGGNARGNLDPMIHEGYAYAMTTNNLPDGSAPGTQDIITQFTRSSPKSYAITTPALIIQGVPDTLFNFNEAIANANQLSAAGAPVKLFTHLGGHIISTVGTIPGGLPESGLQPGAAGSPCGKTSDVILAWYNATLRSIGSIDAIPDVSLALTDGTCATIHNAYGEGSTPFYSIDARAIQAPPITLGISAQPRLLGAGNALAHTTPIATYAQSALLAGIPTLSARATVLGGEATLYFSLIANGAIVDSQVTPIRLAPGQHDVQLDLGGIATRIPAGSDIALSISTWDAQFAHNGGRQPAIATLSDVVIGLPQAR